MINKKSLFTADHETNSCVVNGTEMDDKSQDSGTLNVDFLDIRDNTYWFSRSQQIHFAKRQV